MMQILLSSLKAVSKRLFHDQDATLAYLGTFTG